jgi:maltooligosyltrehalose trehalohydrolase
MPDEPLPFERRLGAFPLGDGHAGFRVWAPVPERVALSVGGREHPMEPAGLGVY